MSHTFFEDIPLLWESHAPLFPKESDSPEDKRVTIARLILFTWLLLVLISPSPWTVLGGAAIFVGFWFFSRKSLSKESGLPAYKPKSMANRQHFDDFSGPEVDPAKMPGTRSVIPAALAAVLSPLVGTYNDPKNGLNPIWPYAPMTAAPLELDKHPKRIVGGQPYGSTPEGTEFIGSMFKDPNELVLDRVFSLIVPSDEAADRTRFIEHVHAGLTAFPKDRYGDPARARLDAYNRGDTSDLEV